MLGSVIFVLCTYPMPKQRACDSGEDFFSSDPYFVANSVRQAKPKIAFRFTEHSNPEKVVLDLFKKQWLLASCLTVK